MAGDLALIQRLAGGALALGSRMVPVDSRELDMAFELSISPLGFFDNVRPLSGPPTRSRSRPQADVGTDGFIVLR